MFKFLKRNPCKECMYYHKENGICASKKTSSTNPYVTFIDKIFCEPRRR